MSSWLLAQTVVEQLRMGGVTDVVLCPGSRNAPLSIALERAARTPAPMADPRRGAVAAEAGVLRLHVRIDERSAGFLALGLAKASGRPVAVVTTSGTAVANLAPAVMEAHEAGVPLLVLSADRPVSMMYSGANQTGDQAGLFGGQALMALRLASGTGSVPAWRSQLRRAIVTAGGLRTRRPGPVQVNLAFDEPLMPTDEVLPPVASWMAHPTDARGVMGFDEPRRGVVLVGDADPATGQRAVDLAARCGLPLLAEPSSNARRGRDAVGAYRLLLGKPDLGGRIERVVVYGHPTLSRPVTQLLRRDDVEVIVVADRADWIDPGFTARFVVDDVSMARCDDPHWRNQWLTGDLTLQDKIELALRDEEQLVGHQVAEMVVEATAGQVLVFGSSNPIRDADLARIPDELYHDGPATRTYANRGLAGIDGTTSTAAGIALALDEPATCLMGDLTFLHDAGGLWLGSLEDRPLLRLVVVDDRGGSIFHTLEQGADEHADSFERVFGTPHAVDIPALGAAHGWQVASVTDRDELRARLRVPIRGPELLHVPVARVDRRAWAQRLATF